VIDIFFAPTILIIALVAIHSWFGLEVLKRGVIFSDLAIGQGAAFGVGLSIVLGLKSLALLFGVGFALIVAILITLALKRVQHIEAYIGLLYAFFASIVVIVLSTHAIGNEELKALIARDILFTTNTDLIWHIGIYIAIFLTIQLFYYRLTGVKKDLLFFILFACMVASSVNVAGVLSVFILLIAPAFIALKLNRGYFIALLSGIAFSLIALIISYNFDLPTGYTLVSTGSFVAVVIGLIETSE
jgi:zinc/manganese transport system permease protein